MAMPDLARRYTVDQVLAFPADGNRYELVAGELLVTPSPAQAHQVVLQRLYLLLGPYLAPHHAVAMEFLSPPDIIWSERDYVQPDLFVVPAAQVTGDWRDCQTSLLAIEVVSPGSARADRLKKRRLYQARGVETYWIVDPASQMVEVWHPQDTRPAVHDDAVRWRLGPDVPELVVELGPLFSELPGLPR